MRSYLARALHRAFFYAALSCLLTAPTALAPTSLAFGADSNEPTSGPNFVVILADDLGYGDLSCYGGERTQTEHLDRLAAEGLRLTDFHSSGAVCSPTRAGLMTGRYQQRAGVPGVINADPEVNRHHGLQTSEITFAELLAAAGYRTGVFGKWHLGYQKQYNPRHHGFDVFRGYVSGNIDYISHYDRTEVYDWWDGLETVKEEGYSTHLITRHAVQFIEQNKDRPFCLYIAHEAPHSPYQGPNDPAERGPHAVKRKQKQRDIETAYRQMVEEMDRGVGDVIAALKRHNLQRNTLVFFFSDNGANKNGDNGPLRGFKGSVWEGGHRVPGIAWRPGVIAAGRESGAAAISIDIMPTLLAQAGIEPPPDRPFDGVDLTEALNSDKAPPRRLFWQTGRQTAMRDGQWKLVQLSPAGDAALFDLDEDLSESNDLAAQHPDRVRSMLAAIDDWRRDVATGAAQQPPQ